MPQEIRVLQCIECLMHQVDIVKKAKKWQCKVCGAKQSLRKECYRGSGAECRAMVQQLNMEEHEKMHKANNETLTLLTDDDDIDWAAIERLENDVLMHKCNITTTSAATIQSKKESKWSAFDKGDKKEDNGGEPRKVMPEKDVSCEVREKNGQGLMNRVTLKRESKWASFDTENELKVEALNALDTDFDWEVVEQIERQAMARETEDNTANQTQSILPATVADDKKNDVLKDNDIEALNTSDTNVDWRMRKTIQQRVMKHDCGSSFPSQTETTLTSVPNFMLKTENNTVNEHQRNILNFGNKRKWSRSDVNKISQTTTGIANVQVSNENNFKKHSKWDQFMN